MLSIPARGRGWRGDTGPERLQDARSGHCGGMRLVVTGASGNVGTALLGRLRGLSEVTTVVAVAARPPPATAPYDRARWAACDLADPDSGPHLAELMRGAGAVVHLAWDIIGSHGRDGREQQRRTNVAGTARVVRAALAAGVPHLVYLSSVAAYSPEPTHRLRVPEHWPRAGIRGSPYSADKVTVERMLDRAALRFPSLRVARLRPPAILQPAAAGELARFTGRMAPLMRHRWSRPPVLPLPGWLTIQVVHTADVAELIWRALQVGAAGAFNVAAKPVLDGAGIAAALRVRRMPAPAALLRATMSTTAAVRVQHLDGSWLRLLTDAPLVSTARAGHELGWQPAHRADEVLAGVRDAAVAGAGAPSARLRPAGGRR
jgi:UDP-glucose 4-epimerase